MNGQEWRRGEGSLVGRSVQNLQWPHGCVGEVADAVQKAGGVLLITADHGNAEQMVDPVKGTPHTAHTANPVPFIVMSAEPCAVKDGSLQDVAPTVLKLLGIEKPADMTGESLV